MAELTCVKWKVIPGTCGLYEVSNFGDIRDKISGKLLHISCNSKGYAVVYMQKKIYTVHRLVGNVFLKKPKSKKPLQIDHIDRNRMNNDLNNLRWVTASENRKNQKECKKRYHLHSGAKIKRLCLENGEEIIFKTIKAAADSLGMGSTTIRERLQSGTPTKSGYKFFYVE